MTTATQQNTVGFGLPSLKTACSGLCCAPCHPFSGCCVPLPAWPPRPPPGGGGGARARGAVSATKGGGRVRGARRHGTYTREHAPAEGPWSAALMTAALPNISPACLGRRLPVCLLTMQTPGITSLPALERVRVRPPSAPLSENSTPRGMGRSPPLEGASLPNNTCSSPAAGVLAESSGRNAAFVVRGLSAPAEKAKGLKAMPTEQRVGRGHNAGRNGCKMNLPRATPPAHASPTSGLRTRCVAAAPKMRGDRSAVSSAKAPCQLRCRRQPCDVAQGRTPSCGVCFNNGKPEQQCTSGTTSGCVLAFVFAPHVVFEQIVNNGPGDRNQRPTRPAVTTKS